jgi:general secretion pathway protein J
MNSRQYGFTLVEMLIAIALFLLLVSLGYGALRTGIRSMEAADNRIDEINGLRISWKILNRSLNDAVSTSKGHGLIFSGNSQSVEFISNMPAYLGFGGYYMIRLSIEETDDSKQLLFSRVPLVLFEDWNDETHLQQAVLVDGIRNINISYYGKLPNTDEKEWQHTWTDRKGLPLLVKINIVRKDGTVWPELTAKLKHAI